MSHTSRFALAALCACALTACEDAPQQLTAPATLSPSFSVSPELAQRHIMPSHARADLHALYVGSVIGGRIQYHGGPVLQSGTKVVAVYWSANATTPIYNGGPVPGSTGSTKGTGTADGSLMGLFLRNLGGSPYFNINTSYTDAAGRRIVNSVAYTGYWATTHNAKTGAQSVSDAEMVQLLQYGFNNNLLTYDPATLYIIFSAGSVNLGGGFGTQYCAYHTHGTVTVGGASRTVLYSAMPYNNATGACKAQSIGPNNSADPGVDPEVSVVAHETEETTTDMLGTAWWDNRGYENADKCAWTWGTTHTAANGAAYNLVLGGKQWLVQRNWVAKNAGCAMSL